MLKKVCSLALALVASAALTAAAEEPAGWKTFNMTDGSFSVMMPGEPTHDVSVDDKTQLGTVESHSIRSRAEPTTYMVGYVIYGTEFPMNPESELEANRDYFIQGIGGKLLSESALKVDGAHALEFTAENARYNIHSRVYFRENHTYQLIAAVSKGAEDAAAVQRFLDSFRLNASGK